MQLDHETQLHVFESNGLADKHLSQSTNAGSTHVNAKHLLLFITVALLFACDAKRQTADLDFDTSVPEPAFSGNGPRVLFDEAHKNIHKADGLYEPFANLIRNDGYQVTQNRSALSTASLKGCNILVIGNALGTNDSNDSSAFTWEECEVVKTWVEAGGALLLITDHAPTGSAAERLGHMFDVTMSKGFTEDSLNYDGHSGDFSQLLFTRENGLLADHPITNGRNERERVDRVMSFTGQSLQGSDPAHAILRLGPTAVDRPPTITVERSGGDVRVHIEYGDPVPATGRAQMLAFQFGNGRVVIMGEAAMLTAQIDGRTKQPFGMNMAGTDNRQLALNIMHWLSGLL